MLEIKRQSHVFQNSHPGIETFDTEASELNVQTMPWFSYNYSPGSTTLASEWSGPNGKGRRSAMAALGLNAAHGYEDASPNPGARTLTWVPYPEIFPETTYESQPRL